MSMTDAVTERGVDLNALVAAEVRAQMARKKRTGVDLAKHLGMAQPTISKRLNGDTPFTVAELAEVAAWLEVPFTALVPIEAVA